MKKQRNLWNEFVSARTIKDLIIDMLSLSAAVASIVLVWFVPFITTWQVIIVAISVAITLATFNIEFFNPSLSYCHSYDKHKHMGLLTLVSVILWMYPISVLWSIIPLGISVFISYYKEDDEIQWTPSVVTCLLLLWILGVAQLNVEEKRYLKSDPITETVVIRSIDTSQQIFYIEQDSSYLSFDDFKILQEAADMKLKNGDTIKIVRHPKNDNLVIKISK